MNKRNVLAGVLALAVLAGGVGMAYAGSQSQALVSLSYLTGIFWDDLKAAVKQDVDRNTAAIYNAAVSQVGASSGFMSRAGVNGNRIVGSIGSGLIWSSGSGVVQSGTLVDATSGTEVTTGGVLVAGHRYLAGTDVTLAAASETVHWLGEGQWTVTAGNPVKPPAVMPFTDVIQGAWYYENVAYVYERGLFDGVTGNSFSPSGKMQRCMMTTVLYRFEGKPAVEYLPLFLDIPEGQWYTEGTIWAGRQGVVTGVGDGEFSPFANVTRQEIAVILYRYAQLVGYDMNQPADLSQFEDSDGVASWAREGISWAVGAGIIGGDNGMLRPYGDATRAEVSAMLHRFAVWCGQ